MAHSTADAESLPVRLADESICIGPEDSAQSYLNIPRLIAAAEVTDAEAIHPGYGFLAENATFAEICRACSIRFIGPSPEVIRLLGDKVRARELARKADVPLLPGSDGAVRDEAEAQSVRGDARLPGAPEGVAGRAAGAASGSSGTPDALAHGRAHVPERGGGRLRLLRDLPREVRGGRAPRRGAGPRPTATAT